MKAQADQRVAQAEGEARSIQLQGDALRANPQIAQLKAMEKWDGHLPAYVTSGAPVPSIGNR